MPFSRHANGPEIITDTPMPPFGVAELLVDCTRLGATPDPLTALTSTDLFRFWLLSHTDTNMIAGPRFWRTGVLRECLPSADSAMEFMALGELLQ
jgi:hypothetical protein